MKRKFSLGVTEFALPAPRTGSIDTLSGLGRGPQVGLEIHQKIQGQRATEFSHYKPEVSISHNFEYGEYIFEVSGRIDGLYDLKDQPKIEEIKSNFNIYELFRRLKDAQNEHPYCLQLRTYGYMYWLQNKKVPDLNLHLVSSRNFETIDFNLNLNTFSYEKWLAVRLAELAEEADLFEKRIKRRKKVAQNFVFPFEKPRSGQIELIKTIEEGMKLDRPMMIQAPTGLGKTVGVLYPTMKEALERGQKVVYLTPKNSQHSVAEDAVEKLQEKGANIKSMTLTAKTKMCFKNEPVCNPDFCEYAKDHYTKVAQNKLGEQLSKKRSLTAKTFKKMAEEHQVCPFELQFEAAHEADTVICDYNYVFSPRASIGKLTGGTFTQKGKPNLVIDEAHNVPSRTLDYFSPSLSVFALEKMRDDANKLPFSFRNEFVGLLDDAIAVVKHCAPQDCREPCKIHPPVEAFLDHDMQLKGFLSTYLKADVDIQPNDVVMKLCFYWSEFTAALEFVTAGRDEFFTTFHPNPATIKITCCDASEMLKACYDDYQQVVAFSATLKPFDFYSQLSGLKDKDLKIAEFASPFPRSNRKLLLIPQISSKYSERQRNYPKIADAIQKIASLKKGNYFAFFPSFDFMERVCALFVPPEGFQVLKQARNMRRDDIEEVLEILSLPGSANIVFAVQGGVFSEGVDYPGDMAIGAFVVGPPLPTFDLEREKMREYYEENYASGFDYAYTYPAMAKAIQAAGRVIRSEKDQGIIVLMDNRFIQPSYVKSMPQDWFEDSPREMVSESILNDIAKFWEEIKS
jgi:DNA excision repair protein ERCC-2